MQKMQKLLPLSTPTTTVSVGTKTLTATWTPQMVYDLNLMYGVDLAVDIEAELQRVLREALIEERKKKVNNLLGTEEDDI